MIISHVIKWKVNPYDHLNRYFDKEELNEVFTLPRNSKEQVNKIIEIFDKDAAVDAELRGMVYRAFGVQQSGEEG